VRSGWRESGCHGQRHARLLGAGACRFLCCVFRMATLMAPCWAYSSLSEATTNLKALRSLGVRTWRMVGSSPAGGGADEPDHPSCSRPDRAECQPSQATDHARQALGKVQWRRNGKATSSYSRFSRRQRPMRKGRAKRTLSQLFYSRPVQGCEMKDAPVLDFSATANPRSSVPIVPSWSGGRRMWEFLDGRSSGGQGDQATTRPRLQHYLYPLRSGAD